jgi:magnesium transporter
MPTEKLMVKDQRKRLLARLTRVPFKYRRTRAATTLAGGQNQEGAPMPPTFLDDVIHVEQAPDEAMAVAQPTTFFGYAFHAGVAPRGIEVLDLAETLGDSDTTTWIDLSQFGAEELQTLAQVLLIHPTAVQAALSAWKSPRLDVFQDHFFVTSTLPTLQTHPYRIQAHQVSLFVGTKFLLSTHQIVLPFAERMLTRSSLHNETSPIDAAFLLYVFLDELLTYYEDLNGRIQGEIEQMEERALLDSSDSFLTELLHFKRYTFALSQLADQHRVIFAVFLRPDFHAIAEHEIQAYYRDLDSRQARVVENLRSAKESVNGIFDIYVSRVSHQTNNVMKILTIVSTILLPSTLIFTFFSTQTIQTIPLLTHRAGFLLMILSVICVSVIILWRFRHKGWL